MLRGVAALAADPYELEATFDLSGTVVLKRYRACSVSTLAQILRGSHCWDPSYP